MERRSDAGSQLVPTSGADGKPARFTAKDVRPILSTIGASFLLSCLSAFFALRAAYPMPAPGPIDWVSSLVTSVPKIASATSNPPASAFVLASQWLLAPIQLLAWLRYAPPWSERARNVALERAVGQRVGKAIGFLAGYGFLCLWLLGDFSILEIPTLFNGGYAYPPSEAVPQIRVIYASPFALAIYAWLCPLVEVVVLWAFMFLTFNFGAYMSSPDETKA